MRDILFTGFFTEDTDYEAMYQSILMPSMLKFNLRFDFKMIESEGKWIENVAKKPKIILETMKEYPQYDLFVIDVDAEFLQYPSLLYTVPVEYDVGVHRLSWKEWYGHDIDRKELLSGSLFIRNNVKMKEVVKEWGERAERTNQWEQKCLEEVLDSRKDIKEFSLPIEYIYIKTMPDGSEPRIKCNPVIVHHQASRIQKKKIRGNSI